jgi:hypothetical protein
MFLRFLAYFLYSLIHLSAQDITVNTTVGKDGVERKYYHLEYTLTRENSTLVTPKEWLQCKYAILSGEPINPKGCWCREPHWNGRGSFVIYLKKDVFPIPAYCNSDWLLLKMNANRSPSVYESCEAVLEHALQTKRDLWRQITSLHEGKIEELEVVLELNPYVTVLSETPLQLKLDQCNLYFRTANNVYVDHLNKVHIN